MALLEAAGSTSTTWTPFRRPRMWRPRRGPRRRRASLPARARSTAAVMDASPHLRIIARHGAGTDEVDLAAAARACGLLITRTPGANARAVAEHAITLMLALIKDIARLAAAGRGRRLAATGDMRVARHLSAPGSASSAWGRSARRRPAWLGLRHGGLRLFTPDGARGLCPRAPATRAWSAFWRQATSLAPSALTPETDAADRCRGARPAAARRLYREYRARRPDRRSGAARRARLRPYRAVPALM